MAIALHIDLDTIQANKELTRAARDVGLAIVDLMHDQGRLLAQDAVKRVPPGPEGGTAEQKRKGMSAVAGDIGRVIVPFDSGTESALLKGVNVEGSDGARVFKTQSGAVYGVSKDLFMPNASMKELERLHNRQRSKRTGRVTKAGTYTRDIGRWKFVDRAHVKKSTAKRFIMHKQKKVGQLKAGFVPAADYFAALVGTTAKAIPSWVRKQSKMVGYGYDGMNRKTASGFVEAVNNVPYAWDVIPASMIGFLERNRQKDIERQAIKRLKKVAKDHNARYARAA